MEDDIGLGGEWFISRTDFDFPFLNPNLLGLENVVSSSVEIQYALNHNFFKDGWILIQKEIPLVGNSHVLACFRFHLAWPLTFIGPFPLEIFSFTIGIFRTIVQASDSIEVCPFMHLLVSTTHTNIQESGDIVVIILSVVAGCWVEDVVLGIQIGRLDGFFSPHFADLIQFPFVTVVKSEDHSITSVPES